jgi:hypothetical protein
MGSNRDESGYRCTIRALRRCWNSDTLCKVPYTACMLAANGSWYTTIGGTPAVITTVAAVIITIYVSRYYANKGKIVKALVWTPLAINRIVTRPVTDLSEGLALTWKGEPLRTPYTMRIRILNAGTREVVGDKADYLEPLVIRFSNSICYEAIITRAHGTPVETPISIISSPASQFEVPMPTLNMSSWIDIEMIADGEAEYPRLILQPQFRTARAEHAGHRTGERDKTFEIISIAAGREGDCSRVRL